MDPTQIEEAARELSQRVKTGTSGPLLAPGCRPQSLEDGWRIHRRVSELRGTPVQGWKCGLPPADRWVAAALHEAVPAGGIVRMPAGVSGSGGTGRIEPEIAFVMGRDLPPRIEAYTAEEVMAAVGEMRLAVEVLGCRYEDPNQARGPELMADGMWNQSLVLGPVLASLEAELAFELTVSVAGQPDVQQAASHPNGDPRRPLVWLAEFLRVQGVGLRAGQAVITGSFAGALRVPLNVPVTLRYGELGQVGLTLS